MGGNSNTDIPVGMQGNQTSGGPTAAKSAGVSLALVLCLGMLIWVKLRLVTNVPRMAYAEPDKRHTEPQGSTGATGATGATVKSVAAEPSTH